MACSNYEDKLNKNCMSDSKNSNAFEIFLWFWIFFLVVTVLYIKKEGGRALGSHQN